MRQWLGSRPFSVAALVGVAALVLGACGGKTGSAKGTATVPPAVTTTSDPGAGSLVRPATIDVAYVQQVIDRLDVIYGDAFRALEADRAVTARVKQLLTDAFSGRALPEVISEFSREAESGFQLVRPDPGNPSAAVVSLASVAPSCVVAKTRLTYAAVYRPGFDVGLPFVFFALSPSASTLDAKNPTGWKVIYDGARSDGTEPPNVCSSS